MRHDPEQVLTLAAERKERLDRFLHDRMPDFTRSKIAQWIAEGHVEVNGEVQKAGYMLRKGMTIVARGVPQSSAPDLTPMEVDIEIAFEDEHLVVVSKPRGMASHPAPGVKGAPTVVNVLLARQHHLSAGSAAYRPGIVHRLDKDTTGLMVIAKTDQAHAHLAKQIAAKTAERRYVAWIDGRLPEPRLRIEAPMARDKQDRRKMAVDPHGKPALTHVKELLFDGHHSLVACRLDTGRTHQIRVHLASAGFPVLGDYVYHPNPDVSLALQLHAAFLAFDHPVSGERIALKQMPPEGFLRRAEVDLDWVANW